MTRLTLSKRLVLVYCALLLASTGAFAWIQVRSDALQEQKLVQLLSRNVAEHIAGSAEFMDENGLVPDAVRRLFDQLMTVNPSVEVYILDESGRILGHAAPPGHVKREFVEVGPIERWLAGEPAPIFGDDPRSISGRKVFSAARLERNGYTWGYIYVVLLGEARDLIATDVATNGTLRTTLGWMGTVALLGLFVGVIALRQITRPLRGLTKAMHELDVDRLTAGEDSSGIEAPRPGERDEIAILKDAFSRMAARIADQWRALRRQDDQRREFVANVSHDLRTPLTSLHGYLETLEFKADELSDSERRRYLSAARAQSEKVGRLARELFELARLEHDVGTPEKESFSLVDLVQDVFQKLSLLADQKGQQLVADIPSGIPNVVASLPMIESVLTNLLDNAIRRTPEGTEITVRLADVGESVEVVVSDTGPGLSSHVRERVLGRASSSESTRSAESNGLGLLIVRRILELHESRIEPESMDGPGASFRFRLDAAGRKRGGV